jgi:hypothetical protein
VVMLIAREGAFADNTLRRLVTGGISVRHSYQRPFNR